MTIIESIILGLIEGVTEFLPVSSTFHLVFAGRLMGLESTAVTKLFDVVIQSGAIAAVLWIYAKELVTDRKLLKMVGFSFVPTAVVGFIGYKVIKAVFFESELLMLSAFIGVGLVLWWLEKIKHNYNLRKTIAGMNPMEAIWIGVAQAAAVVPGVSRAGAVIVAMMLLGFKREEAAKYSFILAVPTIIAAGGWDLISERAILGEAGVGGVLMMGTVTAFLAAIVGLKGFIKFLQTHTMVPFAFYRVVLGLALAAYVVI